MKVPHILAAFLLASSSTLAFAENGDTTSLSGKAMHDHPGNNGGGSTSVGKPDESSLSGQAMRDLPGNNGPGKTPKTQGNGDATSLSGKAMKDHPGNK